MNSQNHLKARLDSLLREALSRLYHQDRCLISIPPCDAMDDGHVCERSVVFRLGYYLQTLLLEDDMLSDFVVDAEYNRNLGDRKVLPGFEYGVYPDLIIHKRGTNEYNLLVIEVKAWWSNPKDAAKDERKIKEFIDPNGAYQYQFGLLLFVMKNDWKTKWFSTDSA